jgi:GMP synthase-like glutamine amidotransferase
MSARLLILDNAVHSLLLRPPWHWKAHLRGVDHTVVNVPSGEPIPPLDDFTHLLLAGSEASIMTPKPWFEREARLVRAAADAGLPMLGSCFGHQMLVYALSGPQHLRRSPTPEIGWVSLEILTADDLLAGVPNPWHAFAYHLDEVADPPFPWRVLARSADCPTQILRFGERPIWGIQAHPEMPLAKARVFLGFCLLLSGRERRRALSAMRKPSAEDRVMSDVVARFLEMEKPDRPRAVGSSGRGSSTSSRS